MSYVFHPFYLQEAERRNTNWFKQLFQTSVMQNHTLSFSSGNEKSTYYASINVLADPGWTKGSKLAQYSGNLNANYNLSSKFILNVITDLSYRDETSPYISSTGSLYKYALYSSRTLDPKAYYTRNYSPYNIFNEIDNAYKNIMDIDGRLNGNPLTYKNFISDYIHISQYDKNTVRIIFSDKVQKTIKANGAKHTPVRALLKTLPSR